MLNRNKLYVYFQTHHGPVMQSDNGYLCRCPVCNKNKFELNLKYFIGKCPKGCFNGFLIDVISIYHQINYSEAKELISSIDLTNFDIPIFIDNLRKKAKNCLPKEFNAILDGKTNISFVAREYLKSKNLDLNYLDRIGVSHVDNFIIVPLKRNGDLVDYIYRDFINGGEKFDSKNTLFNEEALILQDKTYLTEDWVGAATMNGVSLQSPILGTIQKNIIIKSPVSQIIIVVSDYEKGLTIGRALMKSKKVKVLNMGWFKEALIGKCPAEVGKENILRLENDTQWLDDQFLFNQFKIYTDKRIVI